MNGLQLFLSNNTHILFLCLCVCVCLSNLRYAEQEVVLRRCLHHLEELGLASYTNCFLSLYDTRFERKSSCKIFASYAPNPVHVLLHFWLPLARSISPTASKPLELSQRVCVERDSLHITGIMVAIAFYVNGLYRIYKNFRCRNILVGSFAHQILLLEHLSSTNKYIYWK